MGEAAFDYQDVARKIEEERKNGAIIFLPSAIEPQGYYKPVLEWIWLDESDVYEAQGKIRIAFSGLQKLSNGAGVEWSPIDTRRTDNGSDKLYVSFQAVGGIRKSDGRIYWSKSEYDLDLEIIKDELKEQYQRTGAKKKSGQELKDYVEYCVGRDFIQKRKHKMKLAESGAKSRVIRAILGLKSQYDRKTDVLGKPFVVVRFVLNHQDPEVKKMFLQSVNQSMTAVFGGSAIPQLGPAPDYTSDAIDVPHHSEPPRHTELSNQRKPESAHRTQQEPPANSQDPEPNSQEMDFMAQDEEGQLRTLEAICRQKNHSPINYTGFTPEKRLDCFRYLMGR